MLASVVLVKGDTIFKRSEPIFDARAVANRTYVFLT